MKNKLYLIKIPKKGELGIVGCSSKKLPVPAPAWLLYSASPLFSLNYQVAVEENDIVRILSAKYGLLNPMEVIKPYNVKLEEAKSLSSPLKTYLKEFQTIRIYVMGFYRQSLLCLPNCVDAMSGSLFQRAKKVGKKGRLKPHQWPMNWILKEVWERRALGYLLKDLKNDLKIKGYKDSTIQAQIERTIKCCLHKFEKSRIRRKDYED